MTTETTDRRTRPRDIPYACKLRLCRPEGSTCRECGRVVYPSNWIQVQKGRL